MSATDPDTTSTTKDQEAAAVVRGITQQSDNHQSTDQPIRLPNNQPTNQPTSQQQTCRPKNMPKKMPTSQRIYFYCGDHCNRDKEEDDIPQNETRNQEMVWKLLSSSSSVKSKVANDPELETTAQQSVTNFTTKATEGTNCLETEQTTDDAKASLKNNLQHEGSANTMLILDHACMLGHPSAGSRLHLRGRCGKINETLMNNLTCMHAGMLGHPLAGSRLPLTAKCDNNSWKIPHICKHACMLGHPSA